MASVSIAPRPRPGSSAPSHVSLSLQALSPLFHTPQDQAAHVLGISLTSLKSACRRLGISRWPYKRGQRSTRRADREHEAQQSVADADAEWIKAFMSASRFHGLPVCPEQSNIDQAEDILYHEHTCEALMGDVIDQRFMHGHIACSQEGMGCLEHMWSSANGNIESYPCKVEVADEAVIKEENVLMTLDEKEDSVLSEDDIWLRWFQPVEDDDIARRSLALV
ncbi:hypothetical protein GUITHDRAFT_111150 [Guillardia theta CCMP2712]|uniref:RWP-RK domain-containing protein n=1 Tax=Guillardia theta (strain CCMP2712) TaxID=905079 RepID=L1J2R1_GUITC|nr:hypothetical protein GUITHDRAFT_111150 [Guillardia theta CCMP2712]EKX42781.1 hypothetical protein GUITHDRAFT_111150 [Guillardia theta CCMP2712]|eukprot:XP_005829761.1 hypothetical protein GUITHDRAFT_111150 [Guillardia theta CCMP2712]